MWKFPFTQHQREYVILILGDTILLLFSIILAVLISYTPPLWWTGGLEQTILVSGLMVSLALFSLYVMGAYNREYQERPIFLLSFITIAMGVVLCIYSTLSYYFNYLRSGKYTFLLCLVLSSFLIFCWHLLIAKFFPKRARRVLLIGNDRLLDEIVQIFKGKLSQHYEVVASYHRGNVNPTIPNLPALVEEKDIDLIIYSVQSQLLKNVAQPLLNLRFQKTDIYDASSFFQKITGKFPIYHLDHLWMLVNSQREFIFPKFSENLKRAFDIFFALVCLPLALPVILFSALLIKLTSKGPAFFIHERLGKDEVPFRLIKLRTMITEAEKDFGPRWAEEYDPRITKVGRILRKLRLDELPQLFNVLKGDMSVVGPRPIRRHFADLLAEEVPYYRLRFLVKPGLTGWAQVNYDYGGTIEGHAEKFQYDLFYFVHQSIWLDVFIFLKTVKIMLWGKGT
jgi:exopolysaccharide biosynthesis polyprenyl glycosylphosphotransferase